MRHPVSSSRRWRAVLFDLDGTFADTAPDLADALNHVRAARGLPPLPLAELRPMASHGARGLLQVGFGLGPDDDGYDVLRVEFLARYADAICVHTRLYDGIQPLLDALQRRALPWGIVTNKATALTLPLLDALALRPSPGCVVCGDTAARPKPAPDPLLHAAARLGVDAADCVYLGDDLRDMQAARAAGMSAAAVAYGYGAGTEPAQWGADFVLAHPRELLARLDG